MANYPIAPWLHPQDTVAPYVQGLHLGAQLQQERQRLSQQANEASVRAQLQQQQLEQESMQAQQRLEVQKAQHQQELALKQQELAQHQQTIQMATEQAAKKYAAMQAYQQEVASGGDPLKAILKYGPAMGQQSSAEAAAMRTQAIAGRGAMKPQFITDPETGARMAYSPMTGAAHILRPQGEPGLTPHQRLQTLTTMRKDAAKAVTDSMFMAQMQKTPEAQQTVTEAKKKVQDLDQQIGDIMKQATKRAVKVPPQDERVAGQVYDTPKGPHLWTGKGWRVATEAAAAPKAPAPVSTEVRDSNLPATEDEELSQD